MKKKTDTLQENTENPEEFKWHVQVTSFTIHFRIGINKVVCDVRHIIRPIVALNYKQRLLNRCHFHVLHIKTDTH